MKTYEITFNGGLLRRGFWLYLWRVTEGSRTTLYVGRTGDSSSRYAASPFSRLGQHLDLRQNAAANMLLRNLRNAGFDPLLCSYRLVAVGPIFPEQDNLESHRIRRDWVGSVEARIAAQLRADGYHVLGTHPKPKTFGGKLYERVLKKFRTALNSEAA
jgi:hypothetical protein